MNESEYVDVLVGISNHNFVVQSKPFSKGSKEADDAKKTMAILAYKSVQEGYGMYRQVGNQFVQLNVDEEYPIVAEIERFVSEQQGYARTGHDSARVERGKAFVEAMSSQARANTEAIQNRRDARYEAMIEEAETEEMSNSRGAR